MTRHVILWTLNCGGPDAENVKADMKRHLEGLKGKVPGLLDIHVYTEPLETSNADVMLDCTLESPEALKAYAVHPAHVSVADEFVRPFTRTRTCMDFEA